jgi:hypothetical protein
MTIEDYQSVYTLWTSTPGIGMRSLDDSREGIERFLLRNPTTCFVAADGDTTVGVILCGHEGWHCPPIQQPHFNSVNLDGSVPDEEIRAMIDHAYEVVVAKFPKYIQKEIKEAAQ